MTHFTNDEMAAIGMAVETSPYMRLLLERYPEAVRKLSEAAATARREVIDAVAMEAH